MYAKRHQHGGLSGEDEAKGSAGPKVRVLVVDDTRTIRATIRALLARSPRIQIVGEASDPYEARELIRHLNPDVITLDVEMPKMNGLEFLKRLMRLHPMPVVMISSKTTANSQEAVRALALGAVECVDIAQLVHANSKCQCLADTVIMAAESRPRRPSDPEKPKAVNLSKPFDWNGKVVLIGASTGGVDALMTVLSRYPADGPPTVIAQHMPAAFLESFTARLDRVSLPSVKLLSGEMKLESGKVCMAPGGRIHAALSRHDPLRVREVIDDGSSAYVPSVHTLFSSGHGHADRVVSVMLTGMGRDGAEAMARLREAGAHTIVQDHETAVIDGMPRAAREAGAAVEVAPLHQIGDRILKSTSNGHMGDDACSRV